MAIGAIVGALRGGQGPVLEEGNKEEIAVNTEEKKDENVKIQNSTPEEEEALPIVVSLPESTDPQEIQKTEALIESLKEMMVNDALTSFFFCASDPCIVPTQTFEVNNYHWNCNGMTLMPNPEAVSGLKIQADVVVVENCIFDGFETGIEIAGTGVIISNNIIRNSKGDGIIITGQKAAIFDNTIEGNKTAGIFIAGDSNEHAIVNNDIKNNGSQGIHISGASALTVSKNAITGNKREGMWISRDARDNLIYSNTMQENGGECGILLSTIGGKTPENNRIEENTIDKDKISCK